MLALHAEGDLLPAHALATERHLAGCEACQSFLDGLRERQVLLKSLRCEAVTPSECSEVRRGVMSAIGTQPQSGGGWLLQFERAIVLSFRRPSYALAACVVIVLMSVSVLARIGTTTHDAPLAAAATFEGEALLRPDEYRDWVRVGDLAARGGPTPAVYVDPAAYREYVRSGRFPDGAVVVRESSERSPHAHGGSPGLLALVRDSGRFEDGWGFFDFTGTDGPSASTAAAVSDDEGCRTCHRNDEQTGPVLTPIRPFQHSERSEAPRAILVLPALASGART
jgi:hypothetical protein